MFSVLSIIIVGILNNILLLGMKNLSKSEKITVTTTVILLTLIVVRKGLS